LSLQAKTAGQIAKDNSVPMELKKKLEKGRRGEIRKRIKTTSTIFAKEK